MKKKTYKGWEKSGIDLGEYLTEPCEINEELYLYIVECTHPEYSWDGLIQGGDPVDSIEGDDFDKIYTFMTVFTDRGKYFYLGILPEFKQTD
jgi:hypothetical protein